MMNRKHTAQDHATKPSPLLRRAKALVALGTVGAALAAAGPASAFPVEGVPYKSSCELRTQLGSQSYAHGSTVTVEADGKSKKFRCNNGTWEEEKTAESAPSATFGGTSGTYDQGAPAPTTTYSSPSGTAVSDNP